MSEIRARLCCFVAALALAAAPGAAAEFLVTDEAAETSGSIWQTLFGVDEPYMDGTDAGKAEEYAETLSMLADGSIIDAANGFSRLGGYKEAARLYDYCTARLSYLRGDIRGAKAAYQALGDFADSPYRVSLCDAMAVHRVYENGKFGYINIDGNIEVEPTYDWAERVFRDESRAPEREGREGSLLPVAAVFAGDVRLKDGEPVPNKGYYGLLRRDGMPVAPMRFDAVLWTKDGLAALKSGSSVELLNIVTGEWLGEAFDKVGEYAEGYVPVSVGGRWGFIAADGEYLPGGLIWGDAAPFSEGYATVARGGKYGYIDRAGNIVIEPQYQNARAFGEGLAAVRLDKRWGFINENGTMVIESIYQDAGVFDSGACPIKLKGKYGLIDKSGGILLNNIYDEITPFDAVYHRAWIRTNKLWGLTNPSGDVVLAPEWGTYTPFNANGLCRVSYRGAYGYIDTRGVLLIQNLYSKAAPFSAERGGVVNTQGEVVYLDKFSRGFIVDSDVPTEALFGFIEGRKAIAETVTDAETGEERTGERIALRLYEVDGSPITNWAYSPATAQPHP